MRRARILRNLGVVSVAKVFYMVMKYRVVM